MLALFSTPNMTRGGRKEKIMIDKFHHYVMNVQSSPCFLKGCVLILLYSVQTIMSIMILLVKSQVSFYSNKNNSEYMFTIPPKLLCL